MYAGRVGGRVRGRGNADGGTLRRRERCGLVTRGRRSLVAGCYWVGSAGRQLQPRSDRRWLRLSTEKYLPASTTPPSRTTQAEKRGTLTCIIDKIAHFPQPRPAVLGIFGTTLFHSRHSPRTGHRTSTIIHNCIKKAHYLLERYLIR